jgi:hypothetical protein
VVDPFGLKLSGGTRADDVDCTVQLCSETRRQLLDEFLREHPLSSVSFDTASIQFQDAAIQSMWQRFETIAETVDRWQEASMQWKLLAFALTMRNQSWQADYHQQRDWIAQIRQALNRLEGDDEFSAH